MPAPQTFDHMSFHLPNMTALRKALVHLQSIDADLEDPGDEIGPEAPGSKNTGKFPASRVKSQASMANSSAKWAIRRVRRRSPMLHGQIPALHAKIPGLNGEIPMLDGQT